MRIALFIYKRLFYINASRISHYIRIKITPCVKIIIFIYVQFGQFGYI
jgi:hypothetical protein